MEVDGSGRSGVAKVVEVEGGEGVVGVVKKVEMVERCMGGGGYGKVESVIEVEVDGG